MNVLYSHQLAMELLTYPNMPVCYKDETYSRRHDSYYLASKLQRRSVGELDPGADDLNHLLDRSGYDPEEFPLLKEYGEMLYLD